MSKYKDRVERRIRTLESIPQIEVKSAIPGLMWGHSGVSCYRSKYYDVATILKLLLDDLGYEIVDDGLVVRRKDEQG